MAINNPYPKGFGPLLYEEAEQGNVRITRSQRPDDELMTAMRNIRDRGAHWLCPAGDYTGLFIDGQLVMSDTPGEAWEHIGLYEHAWGDVLICGLGLGLGLRAILSKDGDSGLYRPESVRVLEMNQDVIDLVGPRFANDPRVEIIHADALTYQPGRGERYHCIWFDIWPTMLDPDPDDEGWQQHLALRRKWKRRLHFVGWMGSWSEWRAHYMEEGICNFLPEHDQFRDILDGRAPACSHIKDYERYLDKS